MASVTQTAFSTILLRLALLLMLSVFVSFMIGEVLRYLGWLSSLNLIILVNVPVLLCAFLLFIALALRAIALQLLHSLRHYFAKPARIQRRLWFLHTKRVQLQQDFQHRSRYIHYVSERQRQRLLQADYRKQIRLLARAIHKDLLHCQPQLDKKTFQTLQKQLNAYRKQYDSAALLALQAKIAAVDRANHCPID